MRRYTIESKFCPYKKQDSLRKNVYILSFFKIYFNVYTSIVDILVSLCKLNNVLAIIPETFSYIHLFTNKNIQIQCKKKWFYRGNEYNVVAFKVKSQILIAQL